MGRQVKCAFCEQFMDKDNSVRYNEKNYHPNCLQKQKDKEELFKYICTLFGLKKPGPTVYSQLKNFMQKNNSYTYKGVLNSLKYFYEVKRNSTKNSNQGIGIVPYVYDEAYEYYEKINHKQSKIETKLNEQLNKDYKVVTVKEQKQKQKKLLDLSLIEGVENSDSE